MTRITHATARPGHTQPMNTLRKILGFATLIGVGWVVMYAAVVGAGMLTL